MNRLAISVPAKLNLHLQVLGKRDDGFHEVRTLLQSIDWFDDLEAQPAPEGRLELAVEPPGIVDCGTDNLVMRAARGLWQRVGSQPGALLRLVKRIPIGGGLGGGSADAAAALVLLDRLWALDLGQVALHQVAAELGSDVPFFLRGGLALGVGRGEEIYPLPDLPEMTVVVAIGGQPVATAEVYGRLRAAARLRAPDPAVFAFASGLSHQPPWSGLANDLEPVVLAGWPEVAGLLAALQRHDPLRAAVTGSGAAVYALFANPGQAHQAADSLAGESGRVFVGTTLTRTRSDLARLLR